VLTSPRFICRLYPVNNFQDTLDEIGNFKDLKGRQEDEVVVFTGMYGLDGYMIWFMHQNLKEYDFSTIGINVRLFLEGTTKLPFWTGRYRPIDVRYDTEQNQYVLFAIDEDSAKLKSKMTDYKVESLKYGTTNKQAKDVLVDVLEAHNIFKVRWFTHPQEQEMRNYEYRYFNIDESWTVLDFINYIADENELEWALRNGVLYIGKTLKAFKLRRSGRRVDKRRDRTSLSTFFYKVSGETRPMDINSHLEGEWRCVWAKHSVGQTGGVSRGCFTEIGSGTVDKRLYFATLEGEYEKSNAAILLTHNSPSHYFSLGNIIKDTGDLKYIEQVSMQTPLDLEKEMDPTNVKFEDGEDEKLVLLKEQMTRTTPYLDQEAGLLFPSPKLEDDEGNKIRPPNSIIFNLKGREHMSAVGPYVMGTNIENEIRIPVKEKQDLRFRFPDGAEVYYDSTRQIWFIQSAVGLVYKQAITDYDKLPEKTRLSDEENMLQIYDGNILFDTAVQHMHLMEAGCFQVVPKSNPTGDGNRKFSLYCDNENGEVRITALNDIKIWIEDGADNVSNGTIQIDCTGTVEVGPSASSVKLAGGGKKLAHANHNHTAAPATGNFGIPLGGSVAPCTDNTTKTEAD
jgi:hypothetical protein